MFRSLTVVLVLVLITSSCDAFTAVLYASPAGSGVACLEEAPCTLTTACGQAPAGSQVLLGSGDYPLEDSSCFVLAADVTITGTSEADTTVACNGACFVFLQAPFFVSSLTVQTSNSTARDGALIEAQFDVPDGTTEIGMSAVTAKLDNTMLLFALATNVSSADSFLDISVDSLTFTGASSVGFSLNANCECSFSLTNSTFDGLGGAAVYMYVGKVSSFLMDNVAISNTVLNGGSIVTIYNHDQSTSGDCTLSDITVSDVEATSSTQMFNFWGCNAAYIEEMTILSTKSTNWVFYSSGEILQVDGLTLEHFTDTVGGVFVLGGYAELMATMSHVTVSDGQFGDFAMAYGFAELDLEMDDINVDNASAFCLASLNNGTFLASNITVSNSTSSTELISLKNLRDNSIVSDSTFTSCSYSPFFAIYGSSVTSSVNFTDVSIDSSGNTNALFGISPEDTDGNGCVVNIDNCVFTGDDVDSIVKCSNDDSSDRMEVNVMNCGCDIDNVLLMSSKAYDANGSCDIDVDSTSNCSQTGRKWILSAAIILSVLLVVVVIAGIAVVALIKQRKRMSYDTIAADPADDY